MVAHSHLQRPEIGGNSAIFGSWPCFRHGALASSHLGHRIWNLRRPAFAISQFHEGIEMRNDFLVLQRSEIKRQSSLFFDSKRFTENLNLIFLIWFKTGFQTQVTKQRFEGWQGRHIISPTDHHWQPLIGAALTPTAHDRSAWASAIRHGSRCPTLWRASGRMVWCLISWTTTCNLEKSYGGYMVAIWWWNSDCILVNMWWLHDDIWLCGDYMMIAWKWLDNKGNPTES